MKILFVLIFGWAYLWHSCAPSKASSETIVLQVQDSIVNKSDSLKTVSFAIDIQPILQHRCLPCHFIGGKMYEKMPFDKAETILSHTEGVLKRIKQEPDAQRIKDFFKQNSK